MTKFRAIILALLYALSPFAWAAGDANYASTALSLHADGADASTTFTDTSFTSKTVTANGNAQISTTWSKFGGSSAKFDGAGDYLSIPTHADFNLGSADFTIRAFVYLTAYPSSNGGVYSATIMARDISTLRSFALRLSGTASSYTEIYFVGFSNNSTYQSVSASYSFALNTEYHIEAVRSGNLVYLFINGVLQNSGGTSFTTTIQASTSNLRIGATNYDATYKYEFPGYIDDIQLYKGAALHTADFTVPTATFLDYAGQLAGNITELLDIVDWRATIWKAIDGSGLQTSAVNTSYSFNSTTLDPYVVTIAPKFDYKWSAGKVVALNDLVISAAPDTTPHIWKCTTAGTAGSTEPTWNLSGTTADNTVTWTYVAPLVDPISLGPKIPQ